MTVRTPIRDFELANPLYKNATVSWYTVANGVKTATLATLYSGASGTAQLSNPQKLNSQGQFKQPVYIEVQVIGTISGISVTGHDTGIVSPSPTFRVQQTTGKLQYSYDAGVTWSDSGDYIFQNRGAWVTGVSYNRNDAVIDGGYLYISLVAHVAGVFATDLAAGKWISVLANADIFALAQWAGTATGTANALALTVAPAITSYTAGQVFRFKSGAAANTTAATVAVSGLAAKAVQRDGSALTGGEIAANKWYEILYDGAAFQLAPIGSDLVLGLSSGSNLIGFIQAGTGATARTLQSRGRDSIDLADFGVVGDGSDETTKVQAAVTAAIVAGKTVTCHGLTVSIKTAIDVLGPITFCFTGGAGFKALAGYVSTVAATLNFGVMLRCTYAGIRFNGVVFDANNVTSIPMVPIWADVQSDYLRVTHCTFKNVAYVSMAGAVPAAMYIRFPNYVVVDSNDFIECCAGPTSQGGRSIVFSNNYYLGLSAVGSTRDSAFGMDGGIGCQVINNRIQYENGTSTISSIIGVTSGAVSFLVSGNIITGQNSGTGIYVWDAGGNAAGNGIVSNNYLDGKSIAGTGTWSMLKVDAVAYSVTIEGNTLINSPTGQASSIGLDVRNCKNIVIRNNTLQLMDEVNAAIAFTAAAASPGPLLIQGNKIQTSSHGILGGGDNGGNPVWIKNNDFFLCPECINVIGTVESECPIYMENNHINNSDVATPVRGTRWDNAFKGALSGDAGHSPHYCAERTVIQCYSMPDAVGQEWTTGTDAGFKIGDQFWFNEAASGGSPGKICTTAGVVGAGAVFKAMANLA